MHFHFHRNNFLEPEFTGKNEKRKNKSEHEFFLFFYSFEWNHIVLCQIDKYHVLSPFDIIHRNFYFFYSHQILSWWKFSFFIAERRIFEIKKCKLMNSEKYFYCKIKKRQCKTIYLNQFRRASECTSWNKLHHKIMEQNQNLDQMYNYKKKIPQFLK